MLIADDHEPFRKGLDALLQTEKDIEVVAHASSGGATVAQAAKLQPDIILMDIQMPETNGIEATRRILNTSPHIGILVLTMFDDDDTVFSALRAGARGYLLKGASKAEVIGAIRAVVRGEAIYGPQVAKRLMDHFANLSRAKVAEAFPELTDREREILNLVAQHSSNQEIAQALNITGKTVRNHVSNILNKLQVIDRAQAIIRARQAGLGGDNAT